MNCISNRFNVIVKSLIITCSLIFYSTTAFATPLTVDEHLFVVRSKAYLLELLNDPDSAKFRRFRYVRDEVNSVSVFCGEINAKNQFGGYVGFKKFFFTTTGKRGIDGDSSSAATSAWLNGYCYNGKGIELKNYE